MILPEWWPPGPDNPCFIEDNISAMKKLPDGVVHTIVTSPPYYGLRKYGLNKICWPKIEFVPMPGLSSVVVNEDECCLGWESNIMSFIGHIVLIFREVKRLLRDDGTLWLNFGDSYTNGGRKTRANDKKLEARKMSSRPIDPVWLKTKDLMGIPWRVAFALQADGWYLRSDVIWSKPNPMTESVTDRPTKSHEYLFLFSKKARYYYDMDAIKEETVSLDPNHPSYRPNSVIIANEGRKEYHAKHDMTARVYDESGRNKRSVWTITKKPFKGAHFATFPPELPEICIKAGTSEKGCCCKCGSPWIRKIERVDQGFNGSKYGEAVVFASGGALSGGTKKSTLGSSNGKLVGKRRTIGWEPSCSCPENDGLSPCIVLDPFAGSGTSMVVAERLKRIGLGIDCNPSLEKHYRNRLAGKDVSDIKSLSDFDRCDDE